MPVPPPDTTETLICALGLAIGLMGFLMGTVLIVTGTCMCSAPRCRDIGSLGVGTGGCGMGVESEISVGREGCHRQERQGTEQQKWVREWSLGEVGTQM